MEVKKSVVFFFYVAGTMVTCLIKGTQSADAHTH